MTLHSRLILIEGIPGSGKTTTARFVRDWLVLHGKQPALFLEGDWQHPADYESVACLDENEYARLRAHFPDQAAFLEQHARSENGEWLFSYHQLRHEHGDQAPDALFETLARYEIYDLPAARHQRLMRQSWQSFVRRALDDDVTYVFECCFLQNPLTTLLARNNLSESAACRHVLDLADIIRPLQPKLVYLAQADVRATLAKVRAERPREWADYVTRYLTGQEYGQAHGLSGFEGVIRFYAMRQALEVDLLRALPIASALLSDRADWETRYRDLAAFLDR